MEKEIYDLNLVEFKHMVSISLMKDNQILLVNLKKRLKIDIHDHNFVKLKQKLIDWGALSEEVIIQNSKMVYINYPKLCEVIENSNIWQYFAKYIYKYRTIYENI